MDRIDVIDFETFLHIWNVFVLTGSGAAIITKPDVWGTNPEPAVFDQGPDAPSVQRAGLRVLDNREDTLQERKMTFLMLLTPKIDNRLERRESGAGVLLSVTDTLSPSC